MAVRDVITRSQARENGLKRYFTGVPCPKGHVAERQVSSRSCIECARERAQRWRSENAGHIKAYSRRYHQENIDQQRRKCRRYRKENPEYFKAYYRENLSQYRSMVLNRRARRRNAVPSWFGELDELAMQEAADLCRVREKETGVKWEVDHMIPLKAREACGLHCASNIQVIPTALNRSKHNRLVLCEPLEWLAYV